MPKNYRLLLAIAMLVVASLACQAVTGAAPTGGGNSPEVPSKEAPIAEDPSEAKPEPTEAPAGNGGTGLGFETEFPLPADASNGYDLGGGMISFQTKMTIQETLDFYRKELSAKGYKEREITTSTTDTTLNLVFDGHESGKAIVVQAVSLGEGTVNITIRLEDV